MQPFKTQKLQELRGKKVSGLERSSPVSIERNAKGCQTFDKVFFSV